MDKLELKLIMLKNGDTGKELSKALGISETTLSAKLNGKSEFTRKEIVITKKRYRLSAKKIDKIFFDK